MCRLVITFSVDNLGVLAAHLVSCQFSRTLVVTAAHMVWTYCHLHEGYQRHVEPRSPLPSHWHPPPVGWREESSSHWSSLPIEPCDNSSFSQYPVLMASQESSFLN